MLEPEPRALRLALFMPEGSALLCRPVWIVDEHGRQAKLVINPWTGLASIERVPAGGEEEEQQLARAPERPARDVPRVDEPGPVENQPQEGDQP